MLKKCLWVKAKSELTLQELKFLNANQLSLLITLVKNKKNQSNKIKSYKKYYH